METLLTEIQAAERLGTSRRQLRGLRERQAGPPFVKVGALVRYRPEDLEAWVEQHKTESKNGKAA